MNKMQYLILKLNRHTKHIMHPLVPREESIESLARILQQLQFCVSEIGYVLEALGHKIISKTLESLFKAYNDLFEANNLYFTRSVQKLSSIPTKRRKRMIIDKFDDMVDVSDCDDDPDSRILRKRYNKEQYELKMAVYNFFNDEYIKKQKHNNLMTESQLKDNEIQHRREIERKVIACVESIHRYEDDKIKYMFDPFVLTKVCDRVYEELTVDAKDQERTIFNTLIKLKSAIDLVNGGNESVQTALLNLHFSLKRDEEEVEEQIHTYDKNLLSEDYADKVITDAQKGVVASLKDKNMIIVAKAIKIYKKYMRERTIDKGVEVQTLGNIIELENEIHKQKKLVHQTMEQSVIQIKKETSKIREILRRSEINLAHKEEIISGLQSELLLLKSKLNENDMIMNDRKNQLGLLNKTIKGFKDSHHSSLDKVEARVERLKDITNLTDILARGIQAVVKDETQEFVCVRGLEEASKIAKLLKAAATKLQGDDLQTIPDMEKAIKSGLILETANQIEIIKSIGILEPRDIQIIRTMINKTGARSRKSKKSARSKISRKSRKSIIFPSKTRNSVFVNRNYSRKSILTPKEDIKFKSLQQYQALVLDDKVAPLSEELQSERQLIAKELDFKGKYKDGKELKNAVLNRYSELNQSHHSLLDQSGGFSQHSCISDMFLQKNKVKKKRRKEKKKIKLRMKHFEIKKRMTTEIREIKKPLMPNERMSHIPTHLQYKSPALEKMINPCHSDGGVSSSVSTPRSELIKLKKKNSFILSGYKRNAVPLQKRNNESTFAREMQKKHKFESRRNLENLLKNSVKGIENAKKSISSRRNSNFISTALPKTSVNLLPNSGKDSTLFSHYPSNPQKLTSFNAKPPSQTKGVLSKSTTYFPRKRSHGALPSFNFAPLPASLPRPSSPSFLTAVIPYLSQPLLGTKSQVSKAKDSVISLLTTSQLKRIKKEISDFSKIHQKCQKKHCEHLLRFYRKIQEIAAFGGPLNRRRLRNMKEVSLSKIAVGVQLEGKFVVV